MKKVISKIVLLICCLVLVCGAAGCSWLRDCRKEEDYLPEFENDIYRYAVRTDSNGDKTCYIVGLTELGKSKTELILPEEIDGIPVRGLGYERKTKVFMGSEIVGRFESENLLKLFVPFDTEKVSWRTAADTSCPNARYVIWRSHKFLTFGHGVIFGYKLLPEYLVSSTNDFLANVSYMYNYENAGCYWVDSYDNGIISFIPPAPTREGYTFGGWYKEKECINAWNFETDKTGDAIKARSTDLNYYDLNDITFLYAKRIKN